MRKLVVIGVLLGCMLVLGQDQAEVQEQMKVSLRKLDVRVWDAQGDPVRGLTKEAFRLKLKKMGGVIEHFEEMDLPTYQEPATVNADVENQAKRTQDVAEAAQKRSMMLVLDSSTLSRNAYDGAMKGLRDYVAGLPDSMAVQVVQLETQLSPLSELTSNKTQINAALDVVNYKGVIRRKLESHQDQINSAITDIFAKRPGNHAANVDQYTAEKRRTKKRHLRSYTEGLRVLTRMLHQLPGDRSVLWVTGGGYLDFDTRYLVERMTSRLNAHNIPVHVLFAAENKEIGQDRPVPEIEGMNLAYARSLSRSAKAMGLERSTENTIKENGEQRRTMPVASAEQTGGSYVLAKDFDQILTGLKQIDKQASHYYRIWYKDPGEKRKVEVSLANGGNYTLRYGANAEEVPRYTKLKRNERKMEFLGTLQYGNTTNSNFLPTDWDVHLFGDDQNGYRVSVGGLADLSAGRAKEYEIGIALLDENRETLVVSHKLLAPPERDQFNFFDVLVSEKRPHLVSCTIRNMTTSDLSQHLIRVPAAPEGMNLSTITLSDPAARGPIPVSLSGRDIGDGNNPYAVGDGMIWPGFGSDFEGPKMLEVFGHLQERSGSHQDYDLMMVVLKDKEPVHVPAAIVAQGDLNGSTSFFRANLGVEHLEAGTYELFMKAVNKQTGTSTLGSRRFTLKGSAAAIR